MICEARKLITRRGWMAAGSPVLGLRPMRARLSRTWNVRKHNPGAIRSEAPRNGEAKPACSAGHQRSLSVQVRMWQRMLSSVT